MTNESRVSSCVLSQLKSKPKQFEFVQAIRLLMAAKPASKLHLSAELAPLGPSAEIQAIDAKKDGQALRLCLEALSGARGVLPDYFYQQLLSNYYQESEASSAMQDFLTIFDQRAYEICFRSQVYAALVTPDSIDENHATNNPQINHQHVNHQHVNHQHINHQQRLKSRPILPCFKDAVSLPPELDKVPGSLPYGLLLQMKNCHPQNLQRMLADHFELEFSVDISEVRQCGLPKKCLTRIGKNQGKNHVLNRSFVLGKRANLYQRALQVLIKPSSQPDFMRLKLDDYFIKVLKMLIKGFVGNCGLFSLYFYVPQNYIKSPELGRNFQIGKGHFLGISVKKETWVKVAE